MQRVELIAVYLHQAAGGRRRRSTIESVANAKAGAEAIFLTEGDGNGSHVEIAERSDCYRSRRKRVLAGWVLAIHRKANAWRVCDSRTGARER